MNWLSGKLYYCNELRANDENFFTSNEMSMTNQMNVDMLRRHFSHFNGVEVHNAEIYDARRNLYRV